MSASDDEMLGTGASATPLQATATRLGVSPESQLMGWTGLPRGSTSVPLESHEPGMAEAGPGNMTMVPRTLGGLASTPKTLECATADAPAVVQAEFLLHFFATLGGSRHFAPALRLRRAYAPDEVEACLADLAGILRARAPGGAPCLDTAARHMVKEFQSGALGAYTLDALPG